jgi:hypothetical protein
MITRKFGEIGNGASEYIFLNPALISPKLIKLVTGKINL